MRRLFFHVLRRNLTDAYVREMLKTADRSIMNGLRAGKDVQSINKEG